MFAPTLKITDMTFTELYTTIDNQMEDFQRMMNITEADYELIVADLSDQDVIEKFMTNA